MSETSPSNPFDFRTPVRDRRLLAGREQEIEEVDEFLRAAAIGKPSHFSLFGPSGMGKSSLLNTVIQVAEERNLLPIKIELREAIVESPITFYVTIFDAALNALLDIGAIDTSTPLWTAWTEHTLLGNSDFDALDPYLQVGLMMAARMAGRVVDDVPSSVLRRDLATIANLAAPKGIRGLVLCMDSAERLDDNRDLAPSLMELAQSGSSLTIVTAAEQSGQLQSVAPRVWAQIEVGPFSGSGAVVDAITRPLAEGQDLELELAPTLRTAYDIHLLTEGRPYEVNLVNYFIWEAINQGEQSDFVLSEAVLERVMHELEQRGRHEASSAVTSIRNLTSDDLVSLSKLAPFEGLTVRQLALGRLMLEDYDDSRLSEVESAVEVDLARFASLGVITVDHDRFELSGGPEARLYLRYAVEKRANQKIGFEDTYARLATGACRQRLAEALVDGDGDRKLLNGSWSRREMGDAVAGRWLNHLADSVGQQNLSALAELLPSFDEDEPLGEFSEKGGLLFGFVLQVGLQTVEYTDIAINVNDLDDDEALERVKMWFEQNEDLLAKYEISVDAYRCELLSPSLAKAAAAYSELRSHSVLVVFMYRSGMIEPAIDQLSHCIDQCEALIGSDPTDPLLRAELADAINRLGFLRATSKDWDKSASALERSRELSLADDWMPIFNLSYVYASRDDFNRAVALAKETTEHLGSVDGVVILHAWFPTPKDWTPKGLRANTVSLPPGWVARFVELQTQVYETQCRPDDTESLKCLLDDLGPSAPPAILRLGGWAELTIMGQDAKAVEFFDRALHATDLEDMEAVAAEHEFAKHRADGPTSVQGG